MAWRRRPWRLTLPRENMKLGTMLKDVLHSLLRRPATERYPLEKRPSPVRARGALRWDPEPCLGCGLCVQDCPADAIQIITLDKKAKRFVLRYHVDRCTFCSQCVQSCRFNCITLDNEDWELAGDDNKAFTMLLGREEDVDDLLAGKFETDAEAAAA